MQAIQAAGVIIEDRDGRILVLRRVKGGVEGETWGLVGGAIESGETAEAALLREVSEEIGVRLDSKRLRHVRQYRWERHERIIMFDAFSYTLTRHERFDINLDFTEHTEFRWEKPKILLTWLDLMQGLYPVLRDRENLD